MDIQSAAAQLMNYLASDPSKLTQFVEHPYSTTAKVTGTDERISQSDMSQIVTQVAAQTSGQELGEKDTSTLASALLGQSGGVHSLTSALFGGSEATSAQGPSTGEILAKAALGGLAARGMATLITSAMGTNKPNDGAGAQTNQDIDLSSLAKLAEGFFGKK